MDKERTKTDFQRGFDAGKLFAVRAIKANYDAWKRANENSDGRSTFPIEDLAIRQVIYGNPTGKPPAQPNNDHPQTTVQRR